MILTIEQQTRLARLEDTAHAWAEEACGEREVSDAEHDKREAHIRRVLRQILGTKRVPRGFFWNGDPRGYALKIDNDRVQIPRGMATDWGGYGLIAHPDTNTINI